MITILNGDVLDHLRELPDKSVHCVVTSPPYWGLRDYGVDGQIGLEKTPEEYVAKMVEVFREVKRVLRDDGTLWLNLGDSYYGSSKGQTGQGKYTDGQFESAKAALDKVDKTAPHETIKAKDMCGIPWMVAFALRADGWYLRSDIIWSKPNPMPESVTDRPTKAHEYVFLLTKQARYYYDADAIREAHSPKSLERYEYGLHSERRKEGSKVYPHKVSESTVENCDRMGDFINPAGRNRRTVWEIATQPTPEAHFATFPEALVEPCIKAGTSERGCCPVCGSSWERMIEKEQTGERLVNGEYKLSKSGRKRADAPGSELSETSAFRTGLWKTNSTVGWQPICTCGNTDTVPCTVLDPFGGSGTVGLVARNLKRDAILIELNPEYVKIMKKKLRLNEQLAV